MPGTNLLITFHVTEVDDTLKIWVLRSSADQTSRSLNENLISPLSFGLSTPAKEVLNTWRHGYTATVCRHFSNGGNYFHFLCV